MGKLEPASFESLERIGHSVVAQLQRRLALAAVEVSEEQIRFSRVLGWQLVALFFTCLTIAMVALLVVAGFWDTSHRMAALGWTCGISAAGSGALWWIWRDKVRRKPVILATTLAELAKDAAALDPARLPGAEPPP